MKGNGISARRCALAAIFAALIAVGAFIKIPIGMVPITLQPFFVALAAFFLGAELGACAVAVYVAMGLIGIPVFTQGGGIWYVLQPSFGYLIGFILGAYIAGLVVRGLRSSGFFTYLAGGGAMLAALYAIGLPYLYCIVNFYMGKSITPAQVLTSYCLIFLPGDILSCIVAAFAARKLKPLLKASRLWEA